MENRDWGRGFFFHLWFCGREKTLKSCSKAVLCLQTGFIFMRFIFNFIQMFIYKIIQDLYPNWHQRNLLGVALLVAKGFNDPQGEWMGLSSVRVPWGSTCMNPIRNPFQGHSDTGKMPPLGEGCQLLCTVWYGVLQSTHTFLKTVPGGLLPWRVPRKLPTMSIALGHSNPKSFPWCS